MQRLVLMLVLLSILIQVWASPNFEDYNDDIVSETIKEIFGNPGQKLYTTAEKWTKAVTRSTDSNEVILNEKNAKCSTYDSLEGVCVSYNVCQEKGTLADGVQIRFKEIKCPHSTVCCFLTQTVQDFASAPALPERLTQIKGCGMRNPDGVGSRYIKQNKKDVAEYGEFPWMVAVVTSFYEPGSEHSSYGEQTTAYVCGGSLIHPSVVLTAAHHVSNHKKLMVKAGDVDTNDESKIYPSQERDVSSVVVHKQFDNINLYYDIALLFLALPMELAPNVGLVCLPPPLQRTPDRIKCISTGWGKNKFGEEGQFQATLKRLELPVVDRSKCQVALRKTRLGQLFQLHSTFMCALGEEGKDTCTGDGGSPLVCPIQKETDRYVQSGIVAWGIGCGADGSPGVYVDVSQLRDWIDDTVASKGLDTAVYTVEEN